MPSRDGAAAKKYFSEFQDKQEETRAMVSQPAHLAIALTHTGSPAATMDNQFAPLRPDTITADATSTILLGLVHYPLNASPASSANDGAATTASGPFLGAAISDTTSALLVNSTIRGPELAAALFFDNTKPSEIPYSIYTDNCIDSDVIPFLTDDVRPTEPLHKRLSSNINVNENGRHSKRNKIGTTNTGKRESFTAESEHRSVANLNDRLSTLGKYLIAIAQDRTLPDGSFRYHGYITGKMGTRWKDFTMLPCELQAKIACEYFRPSIELIGVIEIGKKFKAYIESPGTSLEETVLRADFGVKEFRTVLFTAEEKKIFVKAYEKTPKQFGLIAQSLKDRNYHDCIAHYYAVKNDKDWPFKKKKKKTKELAQGCKQGHKQGRKLSNVPGLMEAKISEVPLAVEKPQLRIERRKVRTAREVEEASKIRQKSEVEESSEVDEVSEFKEPSEVDEISEFKEPSEAEESSEEEEAMD